MDLGSRIRRGPAGFDVGFYGHVREDSLPFKGGETGNAPGDVASQCRWRRRRVLKRSYTLQFDGQPVQDCQPLRAKRDMGQTLQCGKGFRDFLQPAGEFGKGAGRSVSDLGADLLEQTGNRLKQRHPVLDVLDGVELSHRRGFLEPLDHWVVPTGQDTNDGSERVASLADNKANDAFLELSWRHGHRKFPQSSGRKALDSRAASVAAKPILVGVGS